MDMGDTIAAIASAPTGAPGASGRTLIRVSGPAVGEVERALLVGAPIVVQKEGKGVAFACRIWIDQTAKAAGAALPALAMRFRAPRSFTGQDVLELLVPSQPHLVRRLLSWITSVVGVRLAGPGEFSARAYKHGKITLEQAEGIAAAIAAEHAGQLSAARRLMEGRTGERYRAWRDEMVTLLALVEAGIDFSDQEDVVAIEPAELERRVARARDEIREMLGGSARIAPATSEPPRVVLAGVPNAGKSTLMNALLGRARAVVSPIAGTTRDVLEEPLDLSRWSPAAGVVLLCDTAGLEDASAGGSDIPAQMQRATHAGIAAASLVVHCDPDGRFEALDGEVPRDVPVVRVRTKGDRPGGVHTSRIADIEVCALDGWNLGVLARAIADRVFERTTGEELVLARHRAALSEGWRALSRLDVTMGGEIVAEGLRAAIAAIGELTGRVQPDEVLGRVFSSFCVGK